MKNKAMLIYPPGDLFQRGEDRCQASISSSANTAMRACNDLGYCAAVLEQRGYELLLKDYATERETIDDVNADIQNFRPDLIMISVTSPSIYTDIKFAGHLKSLCNAVIVLKGAMFYAPPEKIFNILNLNDVDYLIGGEAETCIGGIADFALRNQGQINDTDNIFYKNESGVFTATRFHRWVENLDEIPFPARHHMNNKLYVRPDTGEPMATIQSSRGCPSSCIYCLGPHISGKKVRFRSVQNVFDEIAECYYKFNIKNFFFRADTFTINEKWTADLCNMIISSPLHGKINFTANSRTHPISRETLFLMKKAGCFAVAFGYESGSDETLEKIKKGSTVERNLQAAKWARDAGLPVFGFYMIGFPWEGHEHLELTRRHVFETKPDFIEIHIALPYYGTELYELCDRNGTLDDGAFGNDIFLRPGISGTLHLTAAELLDFQSKLIRGYYLRPSYILRKFKDSILHPIILINYIKHGLRILLRRKHYEQES